MPNPRSSHEERNRTNQCNPNHKPTGPGHAAAYTGAEYNRDNRANQLNPNNDKSKGGNSGSNEEN